MERFEKFCGKPIQIEFDEEKIKVYPLSTEQILLLPNSEELEKMSKEEKFLADNRLIKISLKDEKDLTDDLIKKWCFRFRLAILDAIDKVNGWSEANERIEKIERLRKVKE